MNHFVTQKLTDISIKKLQAEILPTAKKNILISLHPRIDDVNNNSSIQTLCIIELDFATLHMALL